MTLGPLRVVLDELAARRDLGAHEHLEHLVGVQHVVDRDALQNPRFGVHGGLPQLLGVHLAQTLEPLDLVAAPLVLPQELLQVILVVDVLHVLGAAKADPVEGRLGNIDVTGVDERPHVAVEEGEQQRADVRTVVVGVSHDDDAVVAHILDVELPFAGIVQAGAYRSNHRPDLGILEDAANVGLLDVEDLPAQRQDRLEAALPALLCGAARRVTLHDVDFAVAGVGRLAVGQLAGQLVVLQRVGTANEIPRLAGGLARLGGLHRLLDDGLADPGVLLQNVGKRLVDDRLDTALRLRVQQFLLRLRLELRIAQLHRDHTRDAFEEVVTGGCGIPLLEEVLGLHVVVQDPRVGGLEAREVGAAVAVGDHVGVGEDGLAERGGVQEPHLDLDLLGVALRLHLCSAAQEDGVVVDGLLFLGQGRRERGDAALLLVDLATRLHAPLVLEDDLDAAGEVGELLQAPLDPLVIETIGVTEHFRIGLEGDARPVPALRGVADDVNGFDDLAPLEAHLVLLAVLPDLRLEEGRQGVHHGRADSVQTTGNLVGVGVELAAGVQFGEDHLDGGPALLGHHLDWDAATVVRDSSRSVLVQHHLDRIRVPREALVDGVVDDLGKQLVVAIRTGPALHVHGGAFADALEPLEDLDAVSSIGICDRQYTLRSCHGPSQMRCPLQAGHSNSSTPKARASTGSKQGILSPAEPPGQIGKYVLDGSSGLRPGAAIPLSGCPTEPLRQPRHPHAGGRANEATAR